MEITATELKKNLGKYLVAAAREDVVITKNGKAVARLISERDYLAGAAELDKLLLLRELPAADVYAEGPGIAAAGALGAIAEAGIDSGAPDVGAGFGAATTGPGLGADEWALTHGGEPVALLTPIPRKKKKRRLGFIKGPGATPEEIAALLESEWTEEDEEEWLNKL